jgi:pyruvate carboxylase
VSQVPTPAFFYGMKNREEILIEIAKGKTIAVRLLNIGDADENGTRTVYFRLNGQTRAIDIKDKKLNIATISNRKASGETEIGTPLQGMISKIFVKEGDTVAKNTPLFTIEAMKMETTITAQKELKVKRIHLKEGNMVESDDLILEY